MFGELWFLCIFSGVIIIPRLLLRYKIPLPLTAFLLGLLPAALGYQLTGDYVIGEKYWGLMATLGITSLFLYAGLEVDLPALSKEKSRLFLHVVIKMALLMGVALAILYWHPMKVSVAALLALAIVTPSTGFIINTINGLNLNENEKFWVRNKAIASEIVALGIMFIALQTSKPELEVSLLANDFLAIVGLILVLPIIFSFLGKVVAPYAESSEFSFLIMMGLIAGYITKSLGVYYLVGAFMVGLIAVRLKKSIPTMASEKNLEAIRLFATFFIPFYFFVAGTKTPSEVVNSDSLTIGLILLAVSLPIRWLVTWIQRRLSHIETSVSSFRVAVALTPTLIFTMVIANLLFERGEIPVELFGGLIAYGLLNTLIPTIMFSLMKKR